jgi:hypothetical protein
MTFIAASIFLFQWLVTDGPGWVNSTSDFHVFDVVVLKMGDAGPGFVGRGHAERLELAVQR